MDETDDDRPEGGDALDQRQEAHQTDQTHDLRVIGFSQIFSMVGLHRIVHVTTVGGRVYVKF